MASEIRVNKIENRSGLGTVTFADTGVDLAGIVTATTFSGSGASLTGLPAAQLSGTLPAISAANLTNVPAANVVGVHTSLTVTNATTTGTAVVGGGVTISESGIEASGIGITCANINGTQIGGRRNIIINGAMNVAQRGTSYSGSSGGYQTVDRISADFTGLDESPTYAQVDLSSSDTPYSSGFRKAFKVTNGNQTSGAGAADRFQFFMKLEGQDVSQSGWNYTSSSSFITLSFWIKSSVAQNFYGYLRTKDGTGQRYAFETGSLTADTWTKVIKTIPGNSNITIDNDNDEGLQIAFQQFSGTDYTDSGVSLNAWGAYSGSTRTPDYGAAMDDWYLTNDATLEYTGVQLEVGSQATPFEHRSFGEELSLCQRYFHKSGDIGTGNEWFPGVATHANHGACPAPCLDGDQDRSYHQSAFPVLMRANPTLTFYPARTGLSNTAGNVSKYNGDVMVALNTQPSSSPSRFTGYFQTATTHPAFTFQYTADAEL